MRIRIFLLSGLFLFIALPASAGWSPFDHDGDGYDDATEVANGWSPYGLGRLDANDADGDGLTDGDELARGTEPLTADTDGDGFSDGDEVRNAYDPLDVAPTKLKKRIVISLAKQELTTYHGDVPLATHRVSTGRPGMPTPTGTYAVLDKKPRAWSAAVHRDQVRDA
jgi:L,D-transpeptidase-like protein/thrombospondin type 3 repeat protein